MSAFDLAENFEYELIKRLRYVAVDACEAIRFTKSEIRDSARFQEQMREAWEQLCDSEPAQSIVATIVNEFTQRIAPDWWRFDRNSRINSLVFYRSTSLPDALRTEIDALLERWEPAPEPSADAE